MRFLLTRHGPRVGVRLVNEPVGLVQLQLLGASPGLLVDALQDAESVQLGANVTS